MSVLEDEAHEHVKNPFLFILQAFPFSEEGARRTHAQPSAPRPRHHEQLGQVETTNPGTPLVPAPRLYAPSQAVSEVPKSCNPTNKVCYQYAQDVRMASSWYNAQRPRIINFIAPTSFCFASCIIEGTVQKEQAMDRTEPLN
jgi:hypothetical protein